jgi:hypothetical protein
MVSPLAGYYHSQSCLQLRFLPWRDIITLQLRFLPWQDIITHRAVYHYGFSVFSMIFYHKIRTMIYGNEITVCGHCVKI